MTRVLARVCVNIIYIIIRIQYTHIMYIDIYPLCTSIINP